MGLETIFRRVRSLISINDPAVTFDIDPGRSRRCDHADTVKTVAGDRSTGGAFLYIDVLRGRVRDRVVANHISIARVWLTIADAAPIFLGGTNVNALAELLLEETRMTHTIIGDRVVAAECAQVDSLIANM